LIGWLNNHGKVRKIFNLCQERVSKDRTGIVSILTYLVANLTRWTTHSIAFTRLLLLKSAIRLGAQEHRGKIIKAQVGAAKGSEATVIRQIAELHCDRLSDPHFWTALETVVGDIEPITYGTNINQADSTRADQVLLTLAGIFLWFSDHPEPEVAAGMTADIEKRWKDSDQSLFLLALILNPFEGLSAFGPRADLSHFKCNGMLMSVRECVYPLTSKSLKFYFRCIDVWQRGLTTTTTVQNAGRKNSESRLPSLNT
jgi:hypothetical protein